MSPASRLLLLAWCALLCTARGGTCPQEYPYAYRPAHNFDWCCATTFDLGGAECRNGVPNRGCRSHGCWNHDNVPCPSPPCEDHPSAVLCTGACLGEPLCGMCPPSHPYAYRPSWNWDHCCNVLADLNGNPFGTPRPENCWNHQYLACQTPPCADHALCPTTTVTTSTNTNTSSSTSSTTSSVTSSTTGSGTSSTSSSATSSTTVSTGSSTTASSSHSSTSTTSTRSTSTSSSISVTSSSTTISTSSTSSSSSSSSFTSTSTSSSSVSITSTSSTSHSSTTSSTVSITSTTTRSSSSSSSSRSHSATTSGTTVSKTSTSTSTRSSSASSSTTRTVSSRASSRTTSATTGSTTAASLVPTATTASTSSTYSSSSTTSTSSASTKESLANTAEAAALASSEAVAAALQRGLASWRAEGAEVGRVSTALGRLDLASLRHLADVAGGAGTAFEGSSGGAVVLTPAMLQALPAGATLGMLGIGSQGGESQDAAGALAALEPLASAILDISVFDADGKLLKVALREPLLLRLPGDGTTGRCVYLDTSGPGPVRWSTEGVWAARDEEVEAAMQDPAGIWCFTTHLSIFAALEDVVFGCTNLELLRSKAFEAFSRNEGWYEQDSAYIVFFVWGVLAAATTLGLLLERWALRLGTTMHTRKRVNICRSFMTWGPHVIKDKYAVFVVYARDILRCMTADKTMLKNQILTSSCQRFLAVRTGISLGTVQQHCWNGSDWIDSDVSLPCTVLCRKLEFHAGAAERVIEEDIFALGLLGVLRRFVLTFLAINPFLDSIRVGHGSYTVAKRAMLQIASVCGVIATNALIFTFHEGFLGWEADATCPINPASKFYIIVATVVSITVNVLPTSFMTDLAKQVFGRPLWILVFWLLLLAYLSTTVLLILVTLANLNAMDQDLWYSALEWGMAVKIVGMPMAQAVRNCVLLEMFLRRDRRCPAPERFRVTMGLSHPSETELAPEARRAAERMAMQAISAEELVRFTALLGDIVMPDFDPESSTSDDVMRNAIEPLCIHAPGLEHYPVSVEVREAVGLQLSAQKQLMCSVLHLGEQSYLTRECFHEQRLQAVAVERRGGFACCCWALEVTLTGIETGHALGFVVTDMDGQDVGFAFLPMDDCLSQVQADGFWAGALPLHATSIETSEGFAMPSAACKVPHKEVRGSRGRALSGDRGGRSTASGQLLVSVRMPQGYMEAIGLHELQRIKSSQEQIGSSSLHLESLAKARAESPPDWGSVMSAGAFCEARTYAGERVPPSKMVVHSRQGKFVELVTAVLIDALGEQQCYNETFKIVKGLLIEKASFTLLDMLQAAKSGGTRYWIEMFAINPVEYHLQDEGCSHWHEGFLSSWPTVLRAMRRFAADRAVGDIQAGKFLEPPGPLMQLLLLDRNFHFMHENGCLAELMLANAMRVRQKLVLHPEHLQGASLGVELQRLAAELSNAYDEQEVSYMAPYLEDRQAVFETVRDLAVSSVKEHLSDDESTWQELNMTDVFPAAVSATAGRTATLRQGQEGDNVMDDGGACDADI